MLILFWTCLLELPNTELCILIISFSINFCFIETWKFSIFSSIENCLLVINSSKASFVPKDVNNSS